MMFQGAMVGEVRNVGEEHGNLPKEKGGDLVNIAVELEKTGTWLLDEGMGRELWTNLPFQDQASLSIPKW